ncbi:prepilin peptidase [Paenibacillus sp. strain BS8-2]
MLQSLGIIFSLLAGLLLAPLLNTIAMRWDGRLTASYPPSYCTHTRGKGSRLAVLPILGRLTSKGRCPACRNSTWWRYAAAEPITGLLFGYSAFRIGFEPELIAVLLLITALVIIVQTDITAMIIPNKVVVPAIVIAFVMRLFVHPLPIWSYLIGALAGSGFLLLTGLLAGWLLKKEAMGGGDIKLYVLIGLILGLKLTLFSLFAASVLGLLGSLAIRFIGRGQEGGTIPFGPYIAAGAVLSYWWGDWLISGYLKLTGFAG